MTHPSAPPAPVTGRVGSDAAVPEDTVAAHQGLPGTGRTFSYGYDLASVGTYGNTTASVAVAARRVATTMPGSLADVPIMG